MINKHSDELNEILIELAREAKKRPNAGPETIKAIVAIKEAYTNESKMLLHHERFLAKENKQPSIDVTPEKLKLTGKS